jgi:hypothetical protein
MIRSLRLAKAERGEERTGEVKKCVVIVILVDINLSSTAPLALPDSHAQHTHRDTGRATAASLGYVCTIICLIPQLFALSLTSYSSALGLRSARVGGGGF